MAAALSWRGSPRVCPVCDAPDAELLTVTAAHLAPDEGKRFEWGRCTTCGLVYLLNPPGTEELRQYYGALYLPHRGPEAWGRWAPLVRWAERSRDRRRVGWALRSLSGRRAFSGEEISALDVGCGRPTFLRALSRATGWRVTGVDSSDAGWRDGGPGTWAGLDLRTGGVEDVGLAPGSFQVTTLWHVLEHVREPRSLLSALHRLARPGGTLIVEVPDHASLSRAVQKEHWIGYDSPRHAVVYEPATLSSILTQSGWRVEGLKRYGTMDPWVLWWLGRQNARGRDLGGSLEGAFLPFVVGKTLALPLAALRRWIPLGVMTAVARRSS